MIKTWRWFGKNDPITLAMLRQIGVEGIVTALYDEPNGAVWSREKILELKDFIAQGGLKWSVVESLPVAESIKYGGSDRDELIENYKTGMRHLGEAGVRTICYNFMPVLDWARTDLNFPLEDGTTCLYFDRARFAYFDIHILQRPGADADYSKEVLAHVATLEKTLTQEERSELIENIIIKTQGFVSGNFDENTPDPVARFRELLAHYKNVDRQKLRQNLKYFLEKVVPVAEEYDLHLCIHPDDPPWQLLGMPRIVTNAEDIEWLLGAVDHPRNGLTFCAGSLSANPENNVPEMARAFASRTHFVHLRSTEVLENGNFYEADHLQGRGHLLQVIREMEKANPGLPMRVDHGRLMLDDAGKNYHAGYSFLGRMFALGQLSGLLAAVIAEMNVKSA